MREKNWKYKLGKLKIYRINCHEHDAVSTLRLDTITSVGRECVLLLGWGN